MRAILGVLILSAGLAGYASAPRPPIAFFPPAVVAATGDHHNGSSKGSRLNEPPLWTKQALRDYRTRYRIMTNNQYAIGGLTSIRIDEGLDGRIKGIVTQERDGEPLQRMRFSVAAQDLNDLRRLIAEARLRNIYPQFFYRDRGENTDETTLCIHGVMTYFERVDDAGYRYSEGNTQCDLGDAQLAVVAKFMDLAGRPDLHRLLE